MSKGPEVLVLSKEKQGQCSRNTCRERERKREREREKWYETMSKKESKGLVDQDTNLGSCWKTE